MNLLEQLIGNTLQSSSPQPLASNAVLFTSQILTPAQQAQARENIGGEAETQVIAVSGPSATITPEENCIYSCGELASLTILDSPSSGTYSIVFRSGTTAATTVVPSVILGLEDFAAAANTIYEINVLDNRAVVGSWEAAASA